MPQTSTLHLIIDPLCGWTYAAAPLMAASLSIDDLRTQVHCGGMLLGPRSCMAGPEWRDYVMPHDRQIALVSGQTFGSAYFDALLQDRSVVLDSLPPSIAILVAQNSANAGVQMLNLLQHAYYVEGKNISAFDTLRAVVAQSDLDIEDFASQYETYQDDIHAHITRARQMLAKVDGRGFPTAVLVQNQQPHVLNLSAYYGKPEQWLTDLRRLIQATHT